ncbi:hypothetical protein A1Q2_07456 [Trichosporon asahii var. asahii CBS 8904]|uniref:Uncharacterized protein n=2 Tax=Trichosporon asahii var. asahii TaxID=189963 RepID=K1VP12_TRIAC|nr:hypothetical protein A1Q1_01344 [Trichosporon asahii var. asahii CBS 2479]EJT49539.1 hypothetical protein A1Q1_01344 [Trichosporon asahii var. asahii CBS 2479]EKC98442.1 hypothetical protein A1Q2_07456 [Trichosporon asahii var. asahii CBS 8904]
MATYKTKPQHGWSPSHSNLRVERKRNSHAPRVHDRRSCHKPTQAFQHQTGVKAKAQVQAPAEELLTQTTCSEQITRVKSHGESVVQGRLVGVQQGPPTSAVTVSGPRASTRHEREP